MATWKERREQRGESRTIDQPRGSVCWTATSHLDYHVTTVRGLSHDTTDILCTPYSVCLYVCMYDNTGTQGIRIRTEYRLLV